MEIKGVNSVIANIRKYGDEAIKDIEGVTELTARNIEKNAKGLAPVDTGKLRQSILANEINKTTWEVEAGGVIAPYAAYMEFGTGGLVNVPNEMKGQALKFVGKGIKKINLRPRPYLYPSFLIGKKEYLDKLKKVLSKYAKIK